MQVGPTSLANNNYGPADAIRSVRIRATPDVPQPPLNGDNRAGAGTKNYFRDQIAKVTASMQQHANNYLGDVNGVGYSNMVDFYQHQLDWLNSALSKAPEKPGFDFYI